MDMKNLLSKIDGLLAEDNSFSNLNEAPDDVHTCDTCERPMPNWEPGDSHTCDECEEGMSPEDSNPDVDDLDEASLTKNAMYSQMKKTSNPSNYEPEVSDEPVDDFEFDDHDTSHPEVEDDASCWGCGQDWRENWSAEDLGTGEGYAQHGLEPEDRICPDCAEELTGGELNEAEMPAVPRPHLEKLHNLGFENSPEGKKARENWKTATGEIHPAEQKIKGRKTQKASTNVDTNTVPVGWIYMMAEGDLLLVKVPKNNVEIFLKVINEYQNSTGVEDSMPFGYGEVPWVPVDLNTFTPDARKKLQKHYQKLKPITHTDIPAPEMDDEDGIYVEEVLDAFLQDPKICAWIDPEEIEFDYNDDQTSIVGIQDLDESAMCEDCSASPCVCETDQIDEVTALGDRNPGRVEPDDPSLRDDSGEHTVEFSTKQCLDMLAQEFEGDTESAWSAFEEAMQYQVPGWNSNDWDWEVSVNNSGITVHTQEKESWGDENLDEAAMCEDCGASPCVCEDPLAEAKAKNYYAIATAAIKKKYKLGKGKVDLTDEQTTEAHKLAKKLKKEAKKLDESEEVDESKECDCAGPCSCKKTSIDEMRQLAGLTECGEMWVEPIAHEPVSDLQKSKMTVTTSMDSEAGTKQVTVTAEGDGADELMKVLQMAGINVAPTGTTMVDEKLANGPNPQTLDSKSMLIDLSGGPNRPQAMTKDGYHHGDNPYAMVEEAVDSLAARLKAQFKSQR